MSNITQIPSFGNGYAKSNGESSYPYLWDGLVGAWCPSMGKQGTKLFDLSIYSRHATMVNWDTTDHYRVEENGHVLKYDGSGDYANIGNIPQINDATQDISISIWAKTSAGLSNCLWYYDDNNALSPGTDFYLIQPSNLQIGGIGGAGQVASGVSINDGKWHHIVIILKNTTLYLYKDGVKQFSTASAHNHANYSTSLNFRIGDDSNVNFWDGNLGDTLVYNRALEPGEVFDLYAGNTPFVSDFPSFITSRGYELALYDIGTDIRATHPTSLTDIDVDIRVAKILYDVNTDIRATHTKVLSDIVSDIRVTHAESLNDINTDIRTTGFTFKDMSVDIRTIQRKFKNINTDIRAKWDDLSFFTINFIGFEEGEFSCSNNVTINMDIESAINMRFRRENEVVFSAFETYSSTKPFTLSSGDGSKSVFIQFQDLLGNISKEIELQILVDSSTPPSVIIESYEDETLTTQILDSVYQNDKGPFFRWEIPNFTIPYVGFSYAFDAVPNNTLDFIISDVVESGLIVTAATPFPEMTLDISSGNFYSTGTRYSYTAGTLLLSDGGAQDRIDLIYVDTFSLEVKAVEGVEAAFPIAPELPVGLTASELAEVLVPAGTTLISNVTITDIRETYVNITDFVDISLTKGIHELQVKAFTECDTSSNASSFNVAVANPCPDMGEVLGWTDITKTIQLVSNIYQTATNSIYLEWVASPNEPGPITYYYTTDGSEPTLASASTTANNLSLGPFPDGVTTINIKPFDDTTGNSCNTRNFIFVAGAISPTGDTLVIGNGLTLKQSLKEIQVKSITWSFDTARVCTIFQPVEFDSNLQFNLNDNIVVVHNDVTIFSGRIKRIDRTITISGEGVTYVCSGPRGRLTECFATKTRDDGVETAIIDFNEVDRSDAVSQIISQVPDIIKNIQSLPTGSKVTDTYSAKTIEQILKNIYLDTEFGWYIKPDGTLVSVSKNVINPEEAKFGIYGTQVSSISPQFNVMDSNLQFDVTRRYNKVVIEGAKKIVLRTGLRCKCKQTGFHPVGLGTDLSNLDFNNFEIPSEFQATKVLLTEVSFVKLRSFRDFSSFFKGFDRVIQFLDFEFCDKNDVTRKVVTREILDVINPNNPEESVPTAFERTTETNREFPQGSLGTNNTVTFPEEVANIWFRSGRANTSQMSARISKTNPLGKSCGTVFADVLLETVPLITEVSVSGTADNLGAKTLRIVDTGFKYSEDPEEPRDDTALMQQFGLEKLESLKDVKVNGTITLDTIDTLWTLDNSVNLVNTAQGAWTSLNAKVIGITYNFDENTTTLELTTEFLK